MVLSGISHTRLILVSCAQGILFCQARIKALYLLNSHMSGKSSKDVLFLNLMIDSQYCAMQVSK